MLDRGRRLRSNWYDPPSCHPHLLSMTFQLTTQSTQTNCLTEFFPSAALDRARHLDAHLQRTGSPIGPLHGLPISLKDTFRLPGLDSSIGIASLAFHPSTSPSTLVSALEQAGAVLYCKTNVPQTLMALDSHNNVFGRTWNPRNKAVTAGGSSGGEGALVALRGSPLGVGTDVGGSIRIPAMCNGLYGVKGSWQRVPYQNQENGTLPGSSKLGLPASAGPIATSLRDCELFFNAVAAQRPWEIDADVAPLPWTPSPSAGLGNSGSSGGLTIGVVRTDGLITPLPPIAKLIDETATALQAAGVKVVELDIQPLFSQCQTLANALFGIDGAQHMFSLLEKTGEPLSPWLATRLKKKKGLSTEKVRELHARRVEMEREWLKIWRGEYGQGSAGGKGGQRIDAFVCPVAPHPVPPVDRWNGVSYTSSFVLLDYPAGTLPVRDVRPADIKVEIPADAGEPLGSWDKVNRELWTKVDRSVYLGTPLCVQVVAPKLMEEKLVRAMGVVEEAVKSQGVGGGRERAVL